MNIETYGKNIDNYTLRGVVVQGENGTDTITFKLAPSETGYTWRVRGTINGGSVQSSEITPREETAAVYVDWTVTENFTQYAGTMFLTLVGVNGDDEITKRVGSVEILPDMAMQAAGTVTQNLFEQLIAAIGNKVEDSEAWAAGTRNGVPVSSTDPAYHNNAHYYSSLAATANIEATTGGGLTVTGTGDTVSIGHTPRTTPAKSTAGLYKAKVDANGHLYDVGEEVPVYADMVTVTGATTLTSAHYGKMVLVDSSSDVTISLPTSTGNGVEIEIVQIGTGGVTISGTILSYEDKVSIGGRYGAVVAKAIGNGVWLLAGCLG